MAVTQTNPPSTNPARSTTSSAGVNGTTAVGPAPFQTDDEILGIETDARGGKARRGALKAQPHGRNASVPGDAQAGVPGPLDQSTESEFAADVPEELQAVFETNPELRDAWQTEKAYREVFPSVEDARTAQAQVAELAQLDAWFFSGQPDAHAQLSAAVYRMNPAAFRSLAQAMANTLARFDGGRATGAQSRATEAGRAMPSASLAGANDPSATDALGGRSDGEILRTDPVGPQNDTAQQDAGRFAAFYQDTNAAVVEGVVDAIRGQVGRLLPEGIATAARNRVVGEIYRELDGSLRSNRALAQQVRQAFRAGAMDAEHQTAVASLILGRAKQALPGVAKKVINEWTTGVLASGNKKFARIHSAESRVDITGGGAPGFSGRRSLAAGEIDYKRLSDADILNL
jgi:hypothetical protein